MLEQTDIQTIKELLEENSKALQEYIAEKIEDNTESILNAVEGRARETEEEIGKRLDRLETIYRIKRLEDSTQADLLKMVIQLQNRVAALENKTA